jgi:2,5-diamino-6-(ribosylamino)-4(3H)-pyrimidinone 5'-phosphate reductase
MLPRVVVHNEISLDARMDRLNVDMGRFYSLAQTWKEDVTLVGADTILAAMPELADASLGGASPDAGVSPPSAEVPSASTEVPTAMADRPAPLLAVVDGRGRVAGLSALRAQPYWRDVVALCSQAAPAGHLVTLAQQGVDHLVAGSRRVDLRVALEWLAQRHRARLVRVDAGGTLVGALLRSGLVHEVSVLIEPRLVGGESRKWLFLAPDTTAEDDVVRLRLIHLQSFDDDTVWLRYEVE